MTETSISELDPQNEIELEIYGNILAQFCVSFSSSVAIEKTRDAWFGIVVHFRKISKHVTEKTVEQRLHPNVK